MTEDKSSSGVSFDARIVLRPRSLDETLDLALAYLRTHHRDFLRLTVLLTLPAMALIAALKLGFDLTWGQTWCVALVVAPLLERCVVAYGGRHLFGNTPRLGTALWIAFKRPLIALFAAIAIPLPLLPVLATNLDEERWVGLGIMLGLFWPFVLAWCLYFSVVVLLEGVSMAGAWRRAAVLISYRYGRALGFVIFGAILRVIAAYSGDLTATFIVSLVLQLGEPLDVISENGGSWAGVLGFILASPYVALSRLFDYVDARTRLEGWDIQVRFKGIATRAKKERSERLAA